MDWNLKKIFFLFFLNLIFSYSIAQQKNNYCAAETKLISAGLVDVQQVDPGILLDLKYSSKDNFVGVDVYGCISHCFLQKNTATQLAKANAALKKINPNLSLLVYDGARPRKAQQILWDTLKSH